MTAIEVILTLLLWSLLIILLFNLLFFITQGYGTSVKGMEAQYSARMIVFNINRDIRSARQVEFMNEGKIIIRGDDNSVAYYQENGIVYRQGKAKIPIAEKVMDLSFAAEDNLIYYSLITGEDNYQYDLQMVCSQRVLLP